jgi:hypothetical protein
MVGALTDAPVDECIGCWNMIKKHYKEVEYVAVKWRSQLFWGTILSVWCAVIGGIFCYSSLSAIPRKKIGKPKKKSEI